MHIKRMNELILLLILCSFSGSNDGFFKYYSDQCFPLLCTYPARPFFHFLKRLPNQIKREHQVNPSPILPIIHQIKDLAKLREL